MSFKRGDGSPGKILVMLCLSFLLVFTPVIGNAAPFVAAAIEDAEGGFADGLAAQAGSYFATLLDGAESEERDFEAEFEQMREDGMFDDVEESYDDFATAVMDDDEIAGELQDTVVELADVDPAEVDALEDPVGYLISTILFDDELHHLVGQFIGNLLTDEEIMSFAETLLEDVIALLQEDDLRHFLGGAPDVEDDYGFLGYIFLEEADGVAAELDSLIFSMVGVFDDYADEFMDAFEDIEEIEDFIDDVTEILMDPYEEYFEALLDEEHPDHDPELYDAVEAILYNVEGLADDFLEGLMTEELFVRAQDELMYLFLDPAEDLVLEPFLDQFASPCGECEVLDGEDTLVGGCAYAIEVEEREPTISDCIEGACGDCDGCNADPLAYGVEGEPTLADCDNAGDDHMGMLLYRLMEFFDGRTFCDADDPAECAYCYYGECQDVIDGETCLERNVEDPCDYCAAGECDQAAETSFQELMDIINEFGDHFMDEEMGFLFAQIEEVLLDGYLDTAMDLDPDEEWECGAGLDEGEFMEIVDGAYVYHEECNAEVPCPTCWTCVNELNYSEHYGQDYEDYDAEGTLDGPYCNPLEPCEDCEEIMDAFNIMDLLDIDEVADVLMEYMLGTDDECMHNAYGEGEEAWQCPDCGVYEDWYAGDHCEDVIGWHVDNCNIDEEDHYCNLCRDMGDGSFLYHLMRSVEERDEFWELLAPYFGTACIHEEKDTWEEGYTCEDEFPDNEDNWCDPCAGEDDLSRITTLGMGAFDQSIAGLLDPVDEDSFLNQILVPAGIAEVEDCGECDGCLEELDCEDPIVKFWEEEMNMLLDGDPEDDDDDGIIMNKINEYMHAGDECGDDNHSVDEGDLDNYCEVCAGCDAVVEGEVCGTCAACQYGCSYYEDPNDDQVCTEEHPEDETQWCDHCVGACTALENQGELHQDIFGDHMEDPLNEGAMGAVGMNELMDEVAYNVDIFLNVLMEYFADERMCVHEERGGGVDAWQCPECDGFEDWPEGDTCHDVIGYHYDPDGTVACDEISLYEAKQRYYCDFCDDRILPYEGLSEYIDQEDLDAIVDSLFDLVDELDAGEIIDDLSADFNRTITQAEEPAAEEDIVDGVYYCGCGGDEAECEYDLACERYMCDNKEPLEPTAEDCGTCDTCEEGMLEYAYLLGYDIASGMLEDIAVDLTDLEPDELYTLDAEDCLNDPACEEQIDGDEQTLAEQWEILCDNCKNYNLDPACADCDETSTWEDVEECSLCMDYTNDDDEPCPGPGYFEDCTEEEPCYECQINEYMVEELLSEEEMENLYGMLGGRFDADAGYKIIECDADEPCEDGTDTPCEDCVSYEHFYIFEREDYEDAEVWPGPMDVVVEVIMEIVEDPYHPNETDYPQEGAWTDDYDRPISRLDHFMGHVEGEIDTLMDDTEVQGYLQQVSAAGIGLMDRVASPVMKLLRPRFYALEYQDAEQKRLESYVDEDYISNSLWRMGEGTADLLTETGFYDLPDDLLGTFIGEGGDYTTLHDVLESGDDDHFLQTLGIFAGGVVSDEDLVDLKAEQYTEGLPGTIGEVEDDLGLDELTSVEISLGFNDLVDGLLDDYMEIRLYSVPCYDCGDVEDETGCLWELEQENEPTVGDCFAFMNCTEMGLDEDDYCEECDEENYDACHNDESNSCVDKELDQEEYCDICLVQEAVCEEGEGEDCGECPGCVGCLNPVAGEACDECVVCLLEDAEVQELLCEDISRTSEDMVDEDIRNMLIELEGTISGVLDDLLEYEALAEILHAPVYLLEYQGPCYTCEGCEAHFGEAGATIADFDPEDCEMHGFYEDGEEYSTSAAIESITERAPGKAIDLGAEVLAGDNVNNMVDEIIDDVFEETGPVDEILGDINEVANDPDTHGYLVDMVEDIVTFDVGETEDNRCGFCDVCTACCENVCPDYLDRNCEQMIEDGDLDPAEECDVCAQEGDYADCEFADAALMDLINQLLVDLLGDDDVMNELFDVLHEALVASTYSAQAFDFPSASIYVLGIDLVTVDPETFRSSIYHGLLAAFETLNEWLTDEFLFYTDEWEYDIVDPDLLGEEGGLPCNDCDACEQALEDNEWTDECNDPIEPYESLTDFIDGFLEAFLIDEEINGENRLTEYIAGPAIESLLDVVANLTDDDNLGYETQDSPTVSVAIGERIKDTLTYDDPELGDGTSVFDLVGAYLAGDVGDVGELEKMLQDILQTMVYADQGDYLGVDEEGLGLLEEIAHEIDTNENLLDADPCEDAECDICDPEEGEYCEDAPVSGLLPAAIHMIADIAPDAEDIEELLGERDGDRTDTFNDLVTIIEAVVIGLDTGEIMDLVKMVDNCPDRTADEDDWCGICSGEIDECQNLEDGEDCEAQGISEVNWCDYCVGDCIYEGDDGMGLAAALRQVITGTEEHDDIGGVPAIFDRLTAFLQEDPETGEHTDVLTDQRGHDISLAIEGIPAHFIASLLGDERVADVIYDPTDTVDHIIGEYVILDDGAYTIGKDMLDLVANVLESKNTAMLLGDLLTDGVRTLYSVFTERFANLGGGGFDEGTIGDDYTSVESLGISALSGSSAGDEEAEAQETVETSDVTAQDFITDEEVARVIDELLEWVGNMSTDILEDPRVAEIINQALRDFLRYEDGQYREFYDYDEEFEEHSGFAADIQGVFEFILSQEELQEALAEVTADFLASPEFEEHLNNLADIVMELAADEELLEEVVDMLIALIGDARLADYLDDLIDGGIDFGAELLLGNEEDGLLHDLFLDEEDHIRQELVDVLDDVSGMLVDGVPQAMSEFLVDEADSIAGLGEDLAPILITFAPELAAEVLGSDEINNVVADMGTLPLSLVPSAVTDGLGDDDLTGLLVNSVAASINYGAYLNAMDKMLVGEWDGTEWTEEGLLVREDVQDAIKNPFEWMSGESEKRATQRIDEDGIDLIMVNIQVNIGQLIGGILAGLPGDAVSTIFFNWLIYSSGDACGDCDFCCGACDFCTDGVDSGYYECQEPDDEELGECQDPQDVHPDVDEDKPVALGTISSWLAYVEGALDGLEDSDYGQSLEDFVAEAGEEGFDFLEGTSAEYFEDFWEGEGTIDCGFCDDCIAGDDCQQPVDGFVESFDALLRNLDFEAMATEIEDWIENDYLMPCYDLTEVECTDCADSVAECEAPDIEDCEDPINMVDAIVEILFTDEYLEYDFASFLEDIGELLTEYIDCGQNELVPEECEHYNTEDECTEELEYDELCANCQENVCEYCWDPETSALAECPEPVYLPEVLSEIVEDLVTMLEDPEEDSYILRDLMEYIVDDPEGNVEAIIDGVKNAIPELEGTMGELADVLAEDDVLRDIIVAIMVEFGEEFPVQMFIDFITEENVEGHDEEIYDTRAQYIGEVLFSAVLDEAAVLAGNYEISSMIHDAIFDEEDGLLYQAENPGETVVAMLKNWMEDDGLYELLEGILWDCVVDDEECSHDDRCGECEGYYGRSSPDMPYEPEAMTVGTAEETSASHNFLTSAIADALNWLEARSDADEDAETVDVQDFVYTQEEEDLVPDDALRNAIKAALIAFDLDTLDPEITEARLGEMRHLSAVDRGIENLTGLEHATSLDYLDLPGNEISDIGVLGDLPLSALSLADNNIDDVGDIPDGLEKLDLSGTDITDIGGLDVSELTRLNLSNTAVSDISGLDTATNLERLYLSGTAVSEIPDLTGLDLKRVTLADTEIGAGDLENLPDTVEVLDISGNEIVNIDGLSEMELWRLNAAGNDLAEADLDNLDNSTERLWELNLADNDLTDLSGLPDVYSLRDLDVSGNDLTELNVDWGQFDSLRTLDVSGSDLSGELTDLPESLEALYAADAVLADGDVGDVAALENLRRLDLSGNPVADGIDALSDMALEMLNLSATGIGDAHMGDVAAIQLDATLQGLKLWVQMLPEETFQDVEFMAKPAGGGELYLADNDITDVNDLVGKRLHTLDLSGNALTGGALGAFVDNVDNDRIYMETYEGGGILDLSDNEISSLDAWWDGETTRHPVLPYEPHEELKEMDAIFLQANTLGEIYYYTKEMSENDELHRNYSIATNLADSLTFTRVYHQYEMNSDKEEDDYIRYTSEDYWASGTVTDVNGEVVEGATVTVWADEDGDVSTSDAEPFDTATTDEDGSFQVILPGEGYTLEVSAEGYLTQEVDEFEVELETYDVGVHEVGIQDVDSLEMELAGDALNSGSVDVADAVSVLRHVAGLEELDDDAIRRALGGGDGEELNSSVAVQILRKAVGLN